MRIGLFGAIAREAGGIDAYVEGARRARDDGLHSFWLSQVREADSLTVLAVVGREVPDLEVGVGVVPIFLRHPAVVAQQALTANLACGGRLVLGLGVSHRPVVERMWGLPFDRPLTRMREYLTVVRALAEGRAADLDGETVTAHTSLELPDAGPFPIVLAALGPKMLALAGELADGTITWMTGAATLAEHTVPTIRKAAADAGRPDPRIIAALPVCVTDDEAGARKRAARRYEVYGALPSYQAMLAREGASGPADVAIVGDEGAVRAQIERLAEARVTELAAEEFGDAADRRRTRELLCSLV
jgi:5,10-methylenetetrahydromethanopterin reductase